MAEVVIDRATKRFGDVAADQGREPHRSER
jgi:hypothetical protein